MREFALSRLLFYRVMGGIGPGGSKNFKDCRHHTRVLIRHVICFALIVFQIVQFQWLVISNDRFPIPHTDCLMEAAFMKFPVEILVALLRLAQEGVLH